jgi:superfamily II DNA/RNA helicase
LIICKFFGSDESGENCNTEIKRKKKKKIFKKSSELSHNGSVRRSEYSNGASRDSYRGKNLQELPISYVKKKKNKKELPISYEEKKKNKKLALNCMLVEDFIQNEEDEALIPSKKLTLKKGSRRTVKTSADRQSEKANRYVDFDKSEEDSLAYDRPQTASPEEATLSMKSTRKRREGVREKNSWVVVQPRDYALESELFISELSRAVVFTEYDDDPVEMHGRDCLEPLSSFEDVQLATVVAENVALAGFIRPTPVQKYSIPVIEAGRDLMASARTGSGKTAAFLLPIFSHLIKNAAKYNKSRVVAKVSRPVVLVLSPTRELAYQIYEHCRRFLYRCAIRPGVVYGGTGLHTQIRMLEEGCDVLVGTPGRLRDLLQRKVLELAFVRFLVLDEADRMLDMGFEPQIRALVEEEDMTDKFARQTLMFSATLPKHLQVLASDFMKEHIYLSVGGAGSSRNILQTVKWVENENKQEALLDLLDAIYDKDSLILVFADTKATVRQLNDFLLRGNYRIVSMHGDLSQREREKALKTFKLGKAPILVATAVCSRGLHIHNIKHVINYDFPRDIDEYTHRIGICAPMYFWGSRHIFISYRADGADRDPWRGH